MNKPKMLHISEEDQEMMFDICARKIWVTNPETGEQSRLGANWKALRDQLSSYAQREFDLEVLQVMINELTEAAREVFEEKYE